MSYAIVHIPASLRPLADGNATVEASGHSVGEVLQSLALAHGALIERILDGNGQPRPFVKVFVDDEDMGSRDGLGTPVAAGSVLHIVPAVAGGRR